MFVRFYWLQACCCLDHILVLSRSCSRSQIRSLMLAVVVSLLSLFQPLFALHWIPSEPSFRICPVISRDTRAPRSPLARPSRWCSRYASCYCNLTCASELTTWFPPSSMAIYNPLLQQKQLPPTPRPDKGRPPRTNRAMTQPTKVVTVSPSTKRAPQLPSP